LTILLSSQVNGHTLETGSLPWAFNKKSQYK